MVNISVVTFIGEELRGLNYACVILHEMKIIPEFVLFLCYFCVVPEGFYIRLYNFVLGNMFFESRSNILFLISQD